MPYIAPTQRPRFDEVLARVESTHCHKRMTFLLYIAARSWIDCVDSPAYQTINAAIGAMECCKMEICRRVEHCDSSVVDIFNDIDDIQADFASPAHRPAREVIQSLDFGLHRSPGELNYVMSRLMVKTFTGNMLRRLMAMETAKQLVYKIVAAPYEDRKIVENGDFL